MMFLNLVLIFRHKSEWFVDETYELEINMNSFFEKLVEEIAIRMILKFILETKTNAGFVKKKDSVGTKFGGPCH